MYTVDGNGQIIRSIGLKQPIIFMSGAVGKALEESRQGNCQGNVNLPYFRYYV
jgi:hypothetical protein